MFAFRPIAKNTHVAGKSFASVTCDMNLGSEEISPIQIELTDPKGRRIPYKAGPLLLRSSFSYRPTAIPTLNFDRH